MDQERASYPYQRFTITSFQEEGVWWAKARVTEKDVGGDRPVLGGPWRSQGEAKAAAEAFCDGKQGGYERREACGAPASPAQRWQPRPASEETHMTRPQGFASYRNFYVEIWQDEREAWWAFLHVTPAGAMRTHHATGKGLPVSGGPWTSRDDAIDAAKTACDSARAVRAPSAVPRCTATRPRRLAQKVRPGGDRAG